MWRQLALRALDVDTGSGNRPAGGAALRRRLKELVLANVALDDGALTVLGDLLEALPALDVLDLSRTPVTAAGVAALLRSQHLLPRPWRRLSLAGVRLNVGHGPDLGPSAWLVHSTIAAMANARFARRWRCMGPSSVGARGTPSPADEPPPGPASRPARLRLEHRG